MRMREFPSIEMGIVSVTKAKEIVMPTRLSVAELRQITSKHMTEHIHMDKHLPFYDSNKDQFLDEATDIANPGVWKSEL